MKYIINDEVFDFDQEDLDLMCVGRGTEGTCYRVRDYYNDFVMKIHHDRPEKVVLDEETFNVLKDINTERIVLPKKLIYDEDGRYIGYTVNYVDYKRPKIRNLKIGKLVDEFYKLEKDVKVLTKHFVYVDDLNYYNTVFSNGIYVCDPGSFSLAETDAQRRYMNYYNRERINEYELFEIIFNLFKFKINERNKLKRILFDDDEFLTDRLSYIGYDQDENAKTYFKSLLIR